MSRFAPLARACIAAGCLLGLSGCYYPGYYGPPGYYAAPAVVVAPYHGGWHGRWR